jgi:hypothetical protein
MRLVGCASIDFGPSLPALPGDPPSVSEKRAV